MLVRLAVPESGTEVTATGGQSSGREQGRTLPGLVGALPDVRVSWCVTWGWCHVFGASVLSSVSGGDESALFPGEEEVSRRAESPEHRAGAATTAQSWVTAGTVHVPAQLRESRLHPVGTVPRCRGCCGGRRVLSYGKYVYRLCVPTSKNSLLSYLVFQGSPLSTISVTLGES